MLPKTTTPSIDLSESVYLVEVFDSSFKISERKDTHEADDGFYGITDRHEHALDDGDSGYLTAFKRNHAYEIHHKKLKDGNFISGSISSDVSGPNPKFIGTMAKKAKELLAVGHKVRIVGSIDSKVGTSKTMFDNYRKIGAVLAKQYGYGITHSEPYSLDHKYAHFYREFTIHPDLSEAGPIGMIMQLDAKSRNEANGYSF